MPEIWVFHYVPIPAYGYNAKLIWMDTFLLSDCINDFTCWDGTWTLTTSKYGNRFSWLQRK